jgi:predicted RNase H-like HicB family nuclease
LTPPRERVIVTACDALEREVVMKHRFHSIIRPRTDGSYVGWVEEIPGTVTRGRSLEECRANLRDALMLMIETNRSEARLWADRSCLSEPVEVETPDDETLVLAGNPSR